MGKRSKRASRRKRKERVKEQSQQPLLTRRALFQGAAGLGITGLLTALGLEYTRDPYAFLKSKSVEGFARPLEELLPYVATIERGNDVDAYRGQWILEQLAPVLKQKRVKSMDEISLKRDAFVIPDPLTPSLKEYCMHAERYLHDNLTGIEVKVDWQEPKAGDNYEKNHHGRGFLGNSVLNHVGLYVRGKHAAVLNHTRRGAYADIRQHVDGSVERWYLFIATGKESLIAPFSEILPIAATESTMQHAQETKTWAHPAVEAMSESISYVLARRLVQELGVPRGAEIVERVHTNLGANREGKGLNRYAYVGKAVEWIKRNGGMQGNEGIQNAFDLYMESPGKFLKAIGAE